VRRGEVYWANVSPRSGSEQKGKRPVVVVSHDSFNRTPGWRSIIVVPVSTSAAQAERGPTAILLPAGPGGLPRASLALCHQVTTLDREKLTKRLGLLGPSALREIGAGLRAAMDLGQEG
jgi:mRNA interferase MazF